MIPLSVPKIAGNEWKYVKDCLDTGWISSVGSYVNQFEKMTAEFVGAKYAVAAMNGSAALHISLRLLGVQQNDYVIVPNITFIASCNSITYAGAEPILMDVDVNTWQMDLNLLEEFLQTKTENKDGKCVLKADGRTVAAIMPVHVLGNMCNMDKLIQIASTHNLQIVEDATEALGSSFKGKHSGTFGKLGCFSYNGNKIISTGGGGMIVTDDEALAKQAKHLTTQAKTHPDEYIHDEIGYNYRLVNILAAVGVAQMEQLPDFLKRKKYITDFYKKYLTGIGDIQFQKVENDVIVNNWLPTIRTSKSKEIFETLKKNEIISRPFWMPMNQLRMFKNNIYFTKTDVANDVYSKSISIPCSTGIPDAHLALVVKLIKSCF